MCLPLLSLMTTIAGAGLKIMETSSNIAAQNKAAEQQAKAANAAAVQDYIALNTRQQEVDMKTALEQTERTRQTMREQSTSITTAAESGVSGNSPMRQLADALVQGGYDWGVHEANQDIAQTQVANEKQSVYGQAKARVAAAKSSLSSPLESGLKMIGAGLSGAASGFDFGDKIKKKRFIY